MIGAPPQNIGKRKKTVVVNAKDRNFWHCHFLSPHYLNFINPMKSIVYGATSR